MQCAVRSEGLRLTSQGGDAGPGALRPLEERLLSGSGGEHKPTRLMHFGFSSPALGEEKDGFGQR